MVENPLAAPYDAHLNVNWCITIRAEEINRPRIPLRFTGLFIDTDSSDGMEFLLTAVQRLDNTFALDLKQIHSFHLHFHGNINLGCVFIGLCYRGPDGHCLGLFFLYLLFSQLKKIINFKSSWRWDITRTIDFMEIMHRPLFLFKTHLKTGRLIMSKKYSFIMPHITDIQCIKRRTGLKVIYLFRNTQNINVQWPTNQDTLYFVQATLRSTFLFKYVRIFHRGMYIESVQKIGSNNSLNYFRL
jgi:hypothetical protein